MISVLCSLPRLFAGLFYLMPLSLTAMGFDQYPQTASALQERYADEVTAHQKYGAYATHALDEGYPESVVQAKGRLTELQGSHPSSSTVRNLFEIVP